MSRENSFSFLILIFPLLFLFIFDSASSSCQDKCGEIEIPYPFGIGEGCYLEKWYKIQCFNNSITFLPTIMKEVVDINSYESISIKNPITSKGCSNNNEKEEAAESLLNLTGSPFYVSYRNTLAAVGCNITASLITLEPTTVGCSTSCGTTHASPTPTENYLSFVDCHTETLNDGLLFRQCHERSIQNETICNGIGCCQTSLPDELLQVVGVRIDGNTWERGCKVAFLTDNTYFFEQRPDPKMLHTKRYATVELGWFIHTTNLTFVDSLECQQVTEDSSFDGLPNNEGCGCECSGDSNYATCACSYGYSGNPYLRSGCKDIDECLEKQDTFGSVSCLGKPGYTCVNRPGGFHCVPPKTNKPIAIGIGVGFGTLILIGGIYCVYKFIKIRRRITRKNKFFNRNGGLLLQQQLISVEGNAEKTKIFSSKELEKATENFSLTRVIGQGGQGTVYKGMLVDGKIVAVKKSKVVDEDKLEEFINEVVILSQINHRNIVKLLGCCLETEVPILVYEFIPNGNLFEHLHDEFDEYTMITWELRLRVAIDVAGALSYLHSAASSPVYHRDIKSTNIMLDAKYQAKVSDFGTSRSVTVDHTHLTTIVTGTVGYVDPEYFQSSQFTDKSDVYSFGVVLVELITGAKPVSFMRSQENRALATYFIAAMKENKLNEIIDSRIREECKLEQVMVVAKLARKCLNLKGRKRPNMRKVSMVLERLCSPHGDSESQINIFESDEEEDAMEVNIGVESWTNMAITGNASTTFLDAESLFPRQTW